MTWSNVIWRGKDRWFQVINKYLVVFQNVKMQKSDSVNQKQEEIQKITGQLLERALTFSLQNLDSTDADSIPTSSKRTELTSITATKR